MQAQVTAIYAALLGVLIIFLAWKVTRWRHRFSVGLGGGGQEGLERSIRAHANAVEYVPLALVLLLVYELNGAGNLVLHLFGAVLLVARVLHAWGISHSSGKSFGRFFGTAGTWVVILVLAGLNIAKALMSAGLIA